MYWNGTNVGTVESDTRHPHDNTAVRNAFSTETMPCNNETANRTSICVFELGLLVEPVGYSGRGTPTTPSMLNALCCDVVCCAVVYVCDN